VSQLNILRSTYVILFSWVVLGIGVEGSAEAQEQKQKSRVQPDQSLVYKTVGDVQLKMDIFLPAGDEKVAQRPALVMFFGGGWVGGSTSQFYKQAKYLASRGMVVFCADYRVRSRHQTTPAECVKDGKSAMRWVRANAEKWKVDPARIAAGGGSAGGHVAAATATVDGFEEEGEDLSVSCRPNALILFNPVYDNGPDGYGNDRVKDYWRQISPLHNLSKETPPTLVFFGTKDKLIPVATAESYRDKMNSLGGDCELHLYEGAEHGFFNSGGAFADTLKKADLFLVRLGYLEGEPGDTSVESIERLAAGR
jgi:acetyl esterase